MPISGHKKSGKSSHQSSCVASSGNKGVCSDSRFPSNHPEIKKYNEYLRSYDSEQKSEREGEAIATDVSKFLRYASEKVDWLHITNPQKVRSYLKYLEKKGLMGA